ncbi:MAG: plastocyanin/azurin family copper-binding protein [Hyphomicrobiales bacterium]
MRLAVFLLVLSASPALAEMHEVKMFNRNAEGAMIYEPQFLRTAPGDKVKFVPTQPSHNAATIEGMIPADAQPFKSRINEDSRSRLRCREVMASNAHPITPWGW